MHELHPKAVWLFFIQSILRLLPLALIFTFVAVALRWSATASNDAPRRQLEIVGNRFILITSIVMLLLVLFLWFWAKLTVLYYRYELREDGFRKEHGIIWKRYVTIPYDRIQNVDIFRGLIARLLGLSDLQIQTAGGITVGSYGAFSEGRLPGLSREVAEQLRDEVIKRARHHARSRQGL